MVGMVSLLDIGCVSLPAIQNEESVDLSGVEFLKWAPTVITTSHWK